MLISRSGWDRMQGVFPARLTWQDSGERIRAASARDDQVELSRASQARMVRTAVRLSWRCRAASRRHVSR